MNEHTSNPGAEEAPTAPAIGEVIAGKYRVESIVGTGGMGVVLAATHLELGQKVAIKVLTLPEDDARLDEARQRFLREGRATAALHSDHVVRVYDVGTLPSGAPFMVMELLRGRDLAQALQQSGWMQIAFACECIRQAAEAIACAHAEGIVHRDLKPSNLFLTERSDGSALIKVLDFGISKATSGAADGLRSDLTLGRSVLGTPFYMSPEQVRDAKNVDARTDIWSLGLILHELLTGSPAFEGTTLPGICAAITADPPAALRLKRPEVPVELEAVVLKCLQKDPTQRFQSARELIGQLAYWTDTSHVVHRVGPSASLGPELAQLRDGSTVSIASDTGTLASAVFTKSGPRGLLGIQSVHTNDSRVDDESARANTVPVRRARTRPLKPMVFAALAILGCTTWLIMARRSAEPATTPLPAENAVGRADRASEIREFGLQIESSPLAAEVYEGETRLGSTPIRISIEAASVSRAPRTFTVRKPGYAPYAIVQGASKADARVLAALTPEPAAPPSATGSAALIPAHLRRARPAPTVEARPAAPPATASSSGDIFMRR